MLSQILVAWVSLSLSCGLFPLILNMFGIERPGVIVVCAPILLPILLLFAPFAYASYFAQMVLSPKPTGFGSNQRKFA